MHKEESGNLLSYKGAIPPELELSCSIFGCLEVATIAAMNNLIRMTAPFCEDHYMEKATIPIGSTTLQ